MLEKAAVAGSRALRLTHISKQQDRRNLFALFAPTPIVWLAMSCANNATSRAALHIYFECSRCRWFTLLQESRPITPITKEFTYKQRAEDRSAQYTRAETIAKAT